MSKAKKCQNSQFNVILQVKFNKDRTVLQVALFRFF